ncbi:uncharacterized protein KY384_008568 [Bacidia gigantensis]|uniref:uncharacterized protein n=1 Tax=Bacidia gigantensis TaxID=2732470 RepID=UPI001D039B6C|nr:uncharacterized protein KY384_008568 [Bacidia gigantensis]KAG8527139.1 hypothetical protein KY384_008568 [Bacidia gigantensis]
MSFGPDTKATEDDEESSTTVFKPKKSNLSRQAIERNATIKPSRPSLLSEQLQVRASEDRPRYSSHMLNELKASTPSTPKDLRSVSDDPISGNKELDLATKFGSEMALHQGSAIPTDVEIKEKKERRARLAKEQEFISLDSDGEPGDADGQDPSSDESSNEETSMLPYAGPQRLKEPPSRLVQDEDEIGEGFDDFVSDGRFALGKKAEREARKRRKDEMKAMIEDAEGTGSSSEEDDSEVERRAAYEAAQTRKGMDGLRKPEEVVKPRRPRTPPKITPLPTVNGILEGLKERKQATEYRTRLQRERLEIVQKELQDIEIRKEEVQRLMSEASGRFEKMKAEVDAEKAPGEGADLALVERSSLGVGIGAATRGLETIGTG